MKIVIDIDERIYNICKGAYKKGCKDKDTGVLAKAIGEGTILPKNHGRLIDADDLEHITICSKTRNSGITRIEAPTIIEASEEGAVG